MSLKKKWIFIILIFILIAPSIARRRRNGCIKTAKGFAMFALSYKLKDVNKIKKTRKLSGGIFLEREGRYDGGCYTAVGRQKARKRAVKNAMNALKQHFINNSGAQKAHIRNKVGYRTYKNNPGLKDADWVQIDYILLVAYPKDMLGSNNRHRKDLKINTTKEKFKLR